MAEAIPFTRGVRCALALVVLGVVADLVRNYPSSRSPASTQSARY
jgi:hypothetical protein